MEYLNLSQTEGPEDPIVKFYGDDIARIYPQDCEWGQGDFREFTTYVKNQMNSEAVLIKDFGIRDYLKYAGILHLPRIVLDEYVNSNENGFIQVSDADGDGVFEEVSLKYYCSNYGDDTEWINNVIKNAKEIGE